MSELEFRRSRAVCPDTWPSDEGMVTKHLLNELG